MSKMEIIDLYADPKALQMGDIIGFNQFPKYSRVQVKGSSGLNIEDFQATVYMPNFRGFVLDTIYKDNKPVAVIIMPLAPITKGVRIENDEKNMMFTNTRLHIAMGLNKNSNWRLNYQPVVLSLDPANFVVPDQGKLVRFGTAPLDLVGTVSAHVDRLMDRGILHRSHFLPPALSKELEGHQVGAYHKVIGSEAHVAVSGDSRAAADVEHIAARQAAERRADKKAAKVNDARALKEDMQSTPSGKIAYSLGHRFNKKANPDIGIDKAYDMGFIDGDTYLILDDIKGSLGVKTIRTIYDAFLNNHAAVYDTLVAKNLCTRDNQESFKGDIEAKVKSAITSFYKYFQALPVEQKAKPEAGIVTYAPARAPA